MNHQDRNVNRIRSGLAIRMLALVVLLGLGSSAALASQATPPESEVATPAPVSGPPRYPDLEALPPDDLYLSTEVLAEGEEHLLLRFSTSAANIGEGPLELAGSNEPGSGEDVAQVVYDSATDGTAVERVHLATDLIFHPEHHHFHLDNFATYELLREDANGDLVATGEGGKQSSCLLDTLPMTEDAPANAPSERYYSECELERQGISVGWKDVYAASLPDQWVDLGDEPLADGSYVLRYAVDPLQLIAEDGRTGNNVSETRFDVADGEIVGRPEPPRCMVEGDASGPVGSTVAVSCSHFPDDAPIEVHWDAWDPWDSDAEPIATFSSQGVTASTGTFQAPDVPPGSYAVAVVAPDFVAQTYVSATVIYGVQPDGAATPEAGHG